MYELINFSARLFIIGLEVYWILHAEINALKWCAYNFATLLFWILWHHQVSAQVELRI